MEAEGFAISGIKCDTLGCDYRDDSVQFKDYPDWVGKPCPKCESNLLTQSDFDKCIEMYGTYIKAAKIAKIFRWFNPFFYLSKILGFIYPPSKSWGKVEILQEWK